MCPVIPRHNNQATANTTTTTTTKATTKATSPFAAFVSATTSVAKADHVADSGGNFGPGESYLLVLVLFPSLECMYVWSTIVHTGTLVQLYPGIHIT